MASQVGGDLSRIETGPCKVSYKSTACGHTMGGVKFNVQPSLRERKVDEYGEYVVEVIHQGDNVELSTVFPEKSMTVIQTVYQWGYSLSSTSWGIGRLPGQKASSKAGELLIHPLDGSSTTDDLTIYKAYVKSSAEVEMGLITADRVFGCTFGCLIDETKSDGQIIGKLGVALT